MEPERVYLLGVSQYTHPEPLSPFGLVKCEPGLKECSLSRVGAFIWLDTFSDLEI